MNVSILCTDYEHAVVPLLRQWQVDIRARGHTASLLFDKKDLVGGDVLFLVSCSQIIREMERRKFGAVLVLHASDLPAGRGWSPHIWSILGGASEITVCLLEARDPVDTGAIWLKSSFNLEGHELLPEINEKLFACELELMTRCLEGFHRISPVAQPVGPGSYCRRRSPQDSRLDVSKPIAEQFDLLRVVDNRRFPAFFDHRGKRYRITIEKVTDEY
jgi:methionyl-tRNA formyltransferase